MTRVGGQRPRPSRDLSRWVILLAAEQAAVLAAAGLAAGLAAGPLIASRGARQLPALLLTIAVTAAIGMLAGGLLGGIQSLVLRGQVRHPWRWAAASALAWPPAAALILIGLHLSGSPWPPAAVIATTVATGLASGGVLGLILGWAAPALRGSSLLGRLLLTLMTSPLRGALPAGLIGLAIQGRVTGQWHQLPVTAAPAGHALVVVPGRPAAKQWWRNLERPSRIRLCRGGRWIDADAWVIRPGEPGYVTSLHAYRRRYRKAPAGAAPLIVRIIPVHPSAVAQPLTPSGRTA